MKYFTCDSQVEIGCCRAMAVADVDAPLTRIGSIESIKHKGVQCVIVDVHVIKDVHLIIHENKTDHWVDILDIDANR